MKISKILLSMCCVAAFTACSNDDDVALPIAEQPHEMSFTVGSGADTRTTLDADGDKLTRVWKSGDKISVIYRIGEENHHEIFTLTDGAGTTSGTFYNATSMIPTTGTQYVHLQTPAGNVDGNWVKTSIATQGDGSISSLGDYDILVGWNWAITDGVWPSKSLEVATSYLHIPTGLTLINNATGEKTISKLVLSGTNVSNVYSRSFSGQGNSEEGDISLSNISLKDGQLTSDLYIAFTRHGGNPEDVKLTLTIDSTDYVIELNDPSAANINNGYVYHVASSSIKTTPSM